MSAGVARFVPAAGAILLEAGFWILVSLLLAGLLHEFVDTKRLTALMERRRQTAVFAALSLGALLPICSCGVVPLAVGFYLEGVGVAAVIAFTAATPIINPAAVLLSYALLGPRLTAVYVIFGLTVPVFSGLMAERYGDGRFGAVAQSLSCGCCGKSGGCTTGAPSHWIRLRRGLRWGLFELGPTLGLYLGMGILLAALITAFVPGSWIPHYLGGASALTSLLVVALFGAAIYVCAVGHIPLVATLLAAGASPGVAIVFLVTGAATNLPELVALTKTLGRRTVGVYVGTMVASSLVAGWLVDRWLLPGYRSPLEPIRSLRWSAMAERITPIIPQGLAQVSAAIVAVLAIWGLARWILRRLPGSLRLPA